MNRTDDGYRTVEIHAMACDAGHLRVWLGVFDAEPPHRTGPHLEWLAFVWGAGREGNPLLRGHGIPSAAVIESLLGASGYDVCPGLDSSASSPEAIWQTAKWWQHYYTAMNLDPMATRYFTADGGEPERSTSGTTRRAAKKAPGVAGNPPAPALSRRRQDD